MKNSAKSLIVLVAIIAVILIGGKIALSHLNVDNYRPDIAEALSKQLGREVKLSGAIKLDISFNNGLVFSVSDVDIANPSWASRPVFAKVGRMELGVGIKPLFDRRVEISSFKLTDADVQLETSPSGESNMALPPDGKQTAPSEPTTTAPEKSVSKPVSVKVNEVVVTNSRFAIRGKDGKVSIYNAKSLTLDSKGVTTKINFDGEISGSPVKLDLTGDKFNKIMGDEWKFTTNIIYANFNIDVAGSLSDGAKEIALDSYVVKSRETELKGHMAISLKGEKPSIRGTLNSDKLVPADLKSETSPADEKNKPTTEPAPNDNGKKYVFSREPLNLAALKSADARLDITIGEVPIGPSAIKDVNAKLDLANGRLLVSPIKMKLAGSDTEGQAMLDASSNPVRASAILKAHQMELSQLVQLGGLESFIAGKGDADMDVSTSGNSPHEMASNASGQFNIITAGGSLSSKVMGDVAGSLLDIFAPGTGQLAKPDVNCMAARFKITNGDMKTNGVLIDTAQATLAANGDINLRDETINMLLRAKSKALDVSAFTPPLRISGSLLAPKFLPDAGGSIEKAAGLFMKDAIADSGVPDIITQNGTNACQYTLDNPQAAKPSATGGAVQDTVNKAKEKIQDVGGKLLKGIGGELFGK